MSVVSELPQILDIPKIFYPVIENINNYRYFMLEGGRNSLKSHTVARFILYLCEQKKLRVVCGREIQKSIEDSVHALFSDLINQFGLCYDIGKATIKHKVTGSTLRFVGLREQGVDSVKSLEGCDIFWGEESHTFTKKTVDILLPTIRKENSKLFFTLNRFIRKDPIFEVLSNRDDCLHIHANFNDIEPRFIAPNVLVESEECKKRNEKDYNHTWLGQPLPTTTEYLFNFDKLAKLPNIQPFGELHLPQSVMSVDFSGSGGDLCVAKLLTRRSNVHWEETNEVCWNDPDTDVSVGKTIALYGQWNPTELIVDADGLGYPMAVTISKTVTDLIMFRGAGESRINNAGNQRADGWLALKDFIDQEWLILNNKFCINDLETIKKKYKPNGKIYIQSKAEMESSPDRGDALMFGIYAIKYYLGRLETQLKSNITRSNTGGRYGRR